MKVLIQTTCGRYEDYMKKYDKKLRKYKKYTVKDRYKRKQRIIEVNSLEELSDIQKRTEQEIIILNSHYHFEDIEGIADMIIEIHDDYRE